jgi:hypothetical protein
VALTQNLYRNKLGNSEDQEKELKNELEKDKPSSSSITPSQCLFKMEVKVDINLYQGEIDVA